jgi:hypothetical protein
MVKFMADSPTHHLIYGTCTDFVTGESVVDTDDERYRQKMARFLVDEKGYAKNELTMRQTIETLFSKQFVTSKIDVGVSLDGRCFMILRYGPGSLVTRERSAIAAARVLKDSYQIPLAVVTNGEDAELLDTYNGKILAQGLEAIPSRDEAKKMIETMEFKPFVDEKRRERELRIMNAFDIEICCLGGPCALPNAPEG